MALVLATSFTDLITNFSFIASIGSVIITAVIAAGSYYGFKNSADKNSSAQIAETINNYKELAGSLSANMADLQTKISVLEVANKNLAGQLAQAKTDLANAISTAEAHLASETNKWISERMAMKADFETERKHWIDQIRECEEKLKNK